MKLFKIIIPCLLLSACLGTSKQAKFYTQTTTAAQIVCADCEAFIGVNRIQLPKYVERPQMVTQQKDSSQVIISEYNRWVEFPSVLSTRVVAENLGILLPSSQVKVNQLKGEGFDWIVSVDVVKLNAVLGEKAELSAWYTLKDKKGKKIVRAQFTRTTPIGSSYEEVAQGYSRLLADLSREMADALTAK